MTDSPSRSPTFNTTRWSLVLAAGDRSSPEAEAAVSELYQRYWLPVYAYVRRHVANAHEAEDLTQDFLCRLNEKNVWAVADPARGRFRSFLLTAARNFLANRWRREAAEKRGGGRTLSVDFAAGESHLSRHPADAKTPEAEFERRWALTLLEHVLARMEAESAADGREEQFRILKQFLAGRSGEASMAQAARELNMSEGAVKTAAHRLRRRYRELLREEIAQTVASPEEIDEEIHSLFQALAR